MILITITLNLKHEYRVSNGKLMEYIVTVYLIHFYSNLLGVLNEHKYDKITN